MPKWSRFFRISFSEQFAVGRGQEIEAAQERRLAAAGGADDGKGLPLLQREADVIEDLCVFKMLFQMLYG